MFDRDGQEAITGIGKSRRGVPDGSVWAGTSGGLAAFDGARFVVPSDALPSPDIEALAVAPTESAHHREMNADHGAGGSCPGEPLVGEVADLRVRPPQSQPGEAHARAVGAQQRVDVPVAAWAPASAASSSAFVATV